MSTIKSLGYKRSIVLLLYTLSAITPLFSCDLTNNLCGQAENLSFDNLNQELCFLACNDNGDTRNITPATLGCEASPFQTVWYRLTSPQYKSILSLRVTSTTLHSPMISIYSGNCEQLAFIDCNQGYNAEVHIQNLLLELNVDYYFAVSSSDGSVGEFEFCLNLEENPNVCNTNSKLETVSTSDGSPLWGPYNPGEEVEICYTIDGYQNIGCNYLQGIVPFFGNGWDASSWDLSGKPKKITQSLVTQGHTYFINDDPYCEGDPAGEWRWHTKGAVEYNLNSYNTLGLKNREAIPAGWVFVNSFDPSCWNFNDGCCTNPDEDPDLGYGDDDFPDCNSGLSQSWKICFTLTASTNPTKDNHDCSVGMKTFGDGELGILIDNSCNTDMISYTNASVKVCLPPAVSLSSNKVEVCKGDAISIDLESDDLLTNFYWKLDGENEITNIGSDRTLTHSFIESGSYIIEVYATNGCQSLPSYVEVLVIEELEIEIVQEPQIVCPGEEVQLMAIVDGVTDVESLNFTWSHDTLQSQAAFVRDYEFIYRVDVYLGSCQATESFELDVYPEMEVWAGEDLTIGCNQNEVRLSGETNMAMDKIEVQWTGTGVSTMGEESTLSPSIYSSGIYTMTVTDKVSGCSVSDAVEVKEVLNNINLELSNPSIIEIDLGESIFLEAHVDIDDSEIAEILWQHDGTVECETCMSSMAYPTTDVIYNIEVVDINGCVDSRSIQVLIREEQSNASKIYLPNTFDPASFDTNNQFRIYGDIDTIEDFVVSDRWGNDLFSVHDMNPDSEKAAWDGTAIGQPAIPGVYVYYLKVTLLDGSTEQRVGTITIIK